MESAVCLVIGLQRKVSPLPVHAAAFSYSLDRHEGYARHSKQVRWERKSRRTSGQGLEDGNTTHDGTDWSEVLMHAVVGAEEQHETVLVDGGSIRN